MFFFFFFSYFLLVFIFIVCFPSREWNLQMVRFLDLFDLSILYLCGYDESFLQRFLGRCEIMVNLRAWMMNSKWLKFGNYRKTFGLKCFFFPLKRSSKCWKWNFWEKMRKKQQNIGIQFWPKCKLLFKFARFV